MRVFLGVFLFVLFTADLASADSFKTTHKCVGDGSCAFTNLVLYKGRFHYVAGADRTVDLPSIPAYRPGPWQNTPVKIRKTTNDLDSLKSSASAVKELPVAVLHYRQHFENWGHHVLDVTPNVHRLLCQLLSQCEYSKEATASTTIVLYDTYPQHRGGFARIWQCFSDQPLLQPLVEASKDDNMLYIFSKAVVGWATSSLIYDAVPQAIAESYVKRLRSCLGVSLGPSASGLQPPVITVVQRPYARSGKARSFLNLLEAVDEAKRDRPQYQFRIAILENMSFDQVVELFHSSTAMVLGNGAAMGNMLFMRRHATVVDVAPGQWYFAMVPTAARNLFGALPLNVVTHTKIRAVDNPIRWESVARSKTFQDLTKEEMLRLLKHHKCPERLAGPCKGGWIYTRSDFVLTGKQLLEWADRAVAVANSTK